MKTCARILLLAFCAFLIAPAQAGEKSLKMEYAGTVHSMADMLVPTDAVIISEADAKGSFGAMQLKVVSKFTPFVAIPDPEAKCDPPKIPMVMEYARSVTTYKDYSQMLVFWDTGWICATPGLTGEVYYVGRVEGRIVAGTGRFEGATGEVVSDFDGYDLSGPFVFEGPPFPTLGSWNGTVAGTVDFAE
jgi:hypothetical protein